MKRVGAGRSSAPVRVLGFLCRFALSFAIGTIVVSLPWVERAVVEPWTGFNARGAAGLSSVLGVEATAQGTRVTYAKGSLDILLGCNGVDAMLLLVSAIVAFPSPWARRLAGVLAGSIAILGGNVVRLASLIMIARLSPARLEFFHVYVWQALIVFLAFALFFVWGTFFAYAKPDTGRWARP